MLLSLLPLGFPRGLDYILSKLWLDRPSLFAGTRGSTFSIFHLFYLDVILLEKSFYVDRVVVEGEPYPNHTSTTKSCS